jgi:phospholipid/cholesterol/gamma-HCH transport system substrate-binding protein
MSNETKIGILAFVAIALSIWGYKFIRGKNLLVASNIYYVEYENIEELKMSSPVLINGFQVGIVADIYLKPDNYEIIIVKLDLDKGIKIPKQTVAQIVATGFMGGKAVKLLFERPCSGEDCAPSGSYLQGEALGLLPSMMGKEDLKDYMDIMKSGLQDIVDSLSSAVSDDPDSPIAKTMQDMQATMANLKASTGQLNSLLARSSGNIEGTLENLEAMTGENGKLQSILENTDTLTGQLAETDIKKMMQEINETITSLQTTLESANGALAGVSTTMDKINQGEGTLGKFMTDEQLYQRLNSLSLRADSLFNDFQARPYRYMPLKSRKKVKKFDRQDAEAGN